MTDGSFKVWHVVLRCDDPEHTVKKSSSLFDARDNDHESVEPEATRESYRAELRAEGWIFHRDGRVTCPTCAARHRPKGVA